MEVAMRTEWVPGLQSSLALWKLDFDSELVYVGDAGTTEPGRPSARRGVEWSNRWIPVPWLLVDADLAWSRARFSDFDSAGGRIPNSVGKVASFAVTARNLGPWTAGVQWRYLGSGPLTEDDSVRSRSSLTANRASTQSSRNFCVSSASSLSPNQTRSFRNRELASDGSAINGKALVS